MRRWLWPTVLGVAVLLFSWWFLTPQLVTKGPGVLLSHLISALLFVGMALCFVAVSWRQLAASAVRRRALVLAAVVRLPFFFYPGYAARDEAGREVAVREGRDHLVEVVLPPGGTAVFGRYAGRPWFLWLDVLAVASWGAFAWGCWRRRRAGGSQGAF